MKIGIEAAHGHREHVLNTGTDTYINIARFNSLTDLVDSIH